MKLKKLSAAVLSMVMAMSVMASCGSDDESSSKKETTTAATTTTAAETTVAETTTAAETTAEESTTAAWPTLSFDPNALVFDDDTMDLSFVNPMGEKDYEGTDESHVDISIQEYNGQKMLKFDILDVNDVTGNYKIPKIQFDMSKIFKGKEENIAKVFTIELDAFYVAEGEFTGDDGTKSMVPGNFMGALVTQTYQGDGEDLKWNQLIDFAESEWTSEWGYVKLSCRPGIGGPYADTTETQYFTFMRWSIPNDACVYIADITFLDEDGNALETAIS